MRYLALICSMLRAALAGALDAATDRLEEFRTLSATRAAWRRCAQSGHNWTSEPGRCRTCAFEAEWLEAVRIGSNTWGSGTYWTCPPAHAPSPDRSEPWRCKSCGMDALSTTEPSLHYFREP